jgi:hypothetical protein
MTYYIDLCHMLLVKEKKVNPTFNFKREGSFRYGFDQ